MATYTADVAWSLRDGEDFLSAQEPLQTAYMTLQRLVQKSARREVTPAEMIALVFGAAEAASRAWLGGKRASVAVFIQTDCRGCQRK